LTHFRIIDGGLKNVGAVVRYVFCGKLKLGAGSFVWATVPSTNQSLYDRVSPGWWGDGGYND